MPLLTTEVEKRKTHADNFGAFFVFIHKHLVTVEIPIIFEVNIISISQSAKQILMQHEHSTIRDQLQNYNIIRLFII